MVWADVKLLPLDIADVDIFYNWQNDPALRNLLMGYKFPVKKNKVLEWLSSVDEGRLVDRIVFSINLSGKTVGMVTAYEIDFLNRVCSVGIFLGDAESLHKGVAKCAMLIFLDYLFNSINIHRVELSVLDFNLAAIALYEKIGFENEGVKKEAYYTGGRYFDVLIYGLLKKNFSCKFSCDANRLSYGPNGVL